MERSELIRTRLNKLRESLKQAKLVAVSKYTDLESIQLAYDHGQKDFGENKLQDLIEKIENLPEDINWHFIGRIQSNKIKKLLKIPNLSHVHSVDSLKVLKEFCAHQQLRQGLNILQIFLQVNTSGESEKGGFENYDDLAGAVNYLLNEESKNIQFTGLMTMGKIRTDHFEDEAKKSFQLLNEMKDQLEADFNLPKLKLSMGMSQDHLIAVEAGSDYVRVGSAIFK